MYKQQPTHPIFGKSKAVNRLTDNSSVPFDPANTDYANFKKDLANGAELQDAEGNVFTLEKVKEYLGTLP